VLLPRDVDFDRWLTLAGRFLPDAKVDAIRGSMTGKSLHVALSTPQYVAEALDGGILDGDEFGFVISDQLQAMDPTQWASVVSRLSAAKRLGITSEPLSEKGTDRVFSYHLGERIFAGKGNRLTPRIRRVWSKWRMGSVSYGNPQFMSIDTAMDLICSSTTYNKHITEQVILALEAKRKIAIFSKRMSHLRTLKRTIESQWPGKILVDYLVPEMSDEDVLRAMGGNVILTTFELAKHMPSVLGLDTIVLATPTKSPMAAIDLALEPEPGKKEPVVVDLRPDQIPVCREYGKYRDWLYRRTYGEKK
jgi:hypothetical protein